MAVKRATATGSHPGGLALALLVAATIAAPARAHGPGPGGAAGELEVQLDPVAPELEGVRAQIHHAIEPQVVLENRTPRTLVVLDADGVPFLRVGPRGVEGNLASPSWYRSFAPGQAGRVPEAVVREAAAAEPPAPRWVAARREPSWGWFDPRIQVEGREAETGPIPWEIPLRIGDQPSALRGRFVVRPEPTGVTRAQLRSEAQLAPGVRVSMLPGRAGSFFLKSDSEQPVTVLGRDGEPFLRLGPQGVEANLRSPTFAEVAHVRGGSDLVLEPRADGEPRWQRISSAPRYGWVDPRTTYDGPRPPLPAPDGQTAPGELLRWSIPVRIGTGEDSATVHIEGVTVWEAFPTDHDDEKRTGRAG